MLVDRRPQGDEQRRDRCADARSPARAPTPPSSPPPARSPLAAPSARRVRRGTIAVQLGNEDPIASMDAGGKVVLARHNEISTVDIKKLDADATPADGERLVLAAKELDVCEIYPQSLQHNANGRFAVVTGDGEYIIYTALAWRKKSFGNALDFVWALDSGEYAVRSAPPPADAPSPARPPRPPPPAPDAHPPLPSPPSRCARTPRRSSSSATSRRLARSSRRSPPSSCTAARSSACAPARVTFFFDWQECRMVRRIDVTAKEIVWSENGAPRPAVALLSSPPPSPPPPPSPCPAHHPSALPLNPPPPSSTAGELVVICCEESFFVLKYNRDVAAAALDSGEAVGEEGVAEAFELDPRDLRADPHVHVGGRLPAVHLHRRAAQLHGGREIITLHHLDRPLYIIGYLPKDNRLYLVDRDYSIVSYKLLLSVLEYQTAVVRRDFEAAAAILPTIPAEEHNRIARFLEAQGFKEEALAVATDAEHRFELAVQLGKLEVAYEITTEHPAEAKWKQLGDLALVSSNLTLAEECLVRAADLAGLLLLYSSSGHADGIERLGELAKKKGSSTSRSSATSSAATSTRAWSSSCRRGARPRPPSSRARTRRAKSRRWWRCGRSRSPRRSPKAAESIADPLDYPNLFDGLELSLKAQEWLSSHPLHEAPASVYPDHAADNDSDLLEHMRALAEGGGADAAAEPAAEAGAEAEPEAEAAAGPSPRRRRCPRRPPPTRPRRSRRSSRPTSPTAAAATRRRPTTPTSMPSSMRSSTNEGESGTLGRPVSGGERGAGDEQNLYSRALSVCARLSTCTDPVITCVYKHTPCICVRARVGPYMLVQGARGKLTD